ncbi:MAG: hypothetical protein HYX24_02935 [Candidatus Aenigmarchaeota archaeon]|nr:hypothetical protein [Candidatus Aenigmarchaeota archaeon]
MKLFQTQEIGSLAKPNWRVKKIQNNALAEHDYQDIRKWSEILGINSAALAELLKKELTPESRKRITEFSSLFAIKLCEKAGLDIVFSGEQFRTEMYQEAIENINGFVFHGHTRSFDSKYYKKAAVVSPPALKKNYHLEEFLFTKNNASKPIKLPLTGAYTLADWSFNEFYTRKFSASSDPKEARYRAKSAFALDLAKNVMQPLFKGLIDAGCSFIQVDEPAAATHANEIPILAESFNESVKGLDCKFSMHICFSDYRRLFPHILEMKKCSQFALEFANRDDERRKGYASLELFNEYNDNREIGLGVIDVHNNFIEPRELVRDRILYAARILDPERIFVNPDCGLRTRSWDIAFSKLRNMAEGAGLARMSYEGKL